jgi:1-deoxy-D-xylulose-5-phosphate reductoisomerase
LRTGGTLPVVLNAANEVAVERFLGGKLGFTAIPRVIKETMDSHELSDVTTLEVVRRVDRWSRECARHKAQALELNT